MTNDGVHVALIKWLATITGVTVIASYQGGAEPALPYVMVNMTGMLRMHDRPQDVLYTDTGGASLPLLLAPEPVITTAAPVNDAEWRFSVHAYGTDPTDILRPVLTAMQVPQLQEPLLPNYFVHEVSEIRYVPDWINAAWQPRAQMDVIMRGLITDGFVIDVIEEGSFDISTEG